MINCVADLEEIFDFIFMLQLRSRIRDLAEEKYGRVSSGDSKPNSWTLLDFGEFYSFTLY